LKTRKFVRRGNHIPVRYDCSKDAASGWKKLVEELLQSILHRIKVSSPMLLAIQCSERELRAFEANQDIYCVRRFRCESKPMPWREFAHLAVVGSSRKDPIICTGDQEIGDQLYLFRAWLGSDSKDCISAFSEPSKDFDALVLQIITR
jgi:hypothetical protein